MKDFGYKRNIEVNECTSRGSCSVSPTIVALEELSVVFLQQLAYYLLKLETFGADNEEIRLEIINVLASLVTVNEFSEQQLYYIVQKEYFMLEEVKKIYLKLCYSDNLKPEKFKSMPKFSSKTSLAQAITLGEKILLDNYNKKSSVYKISKEILLLVLKSISLNLIKLNDFNYKNNEIFNEMLLALKLFSSPKINSNDFDSIIFKLADIDNKLQLTLYDLLIDKFGGISKVNVSRSSQKSKAILVSGANLFDLYKILEDTKDLDIDIYTHSNLLIAHSFKAFRKFKNLKAHYGDDTESCILDFATFPGAILLTKSSQSSSDYFYRGRLFSNDYILPDGVIKITDNDFSPVIDAANSAKGFSRGKNKEEIIVGFDIDEVINVFKDLQSRLNDDSLGKIFIVGINPHSELQKEYFNSFFSKLKKDEYVVSFSYSSRNDNVYTINVGNYYPLVSKLMDLLFKYIPIDSENLYLYFTRCDVRSISNILVLHHSGAKNIYMHKCSPININPILLNSFANKYGVNFY